MAPARSLLALRPQCLRLARSPAAPLSFRSYSDAQKPKGPNSESLPSAPEEAAATAKFTGQTPPDLTQGTPVSEILKRDPKAAESAPKVLKQEANIPSGKRSYSTVAPGNDSDAAFPEPQLVTAVDDVTIHAGIPKGAKFPLPDMPMPREANLHRRYPEIIDQLTNLMMKDGKKARAQSVMTQILSILRTKPAPKLNPLIPIVPSAPPPEALPKDPVAFVQTAIDSVAPLMSIKNVKASGGFTNQLPIPLQLKQRRRTAMMWILMAADKRKARMGLAERVAEEIVAVLEGKSGAWDRRMQIHRQAVAGRSNLKVNVR